MNTTTAAIPVTDLASIVIAAVNQVLNGDPFEDSTGKALDALKQLGYGRCAVCREPGTPDTLEKINNGPSFACRDQKACLRRQMEQELAGQLIYTRSAIAAYRDPEYDLDTAAVAETLASRLTLIDHLLARLGVDGAELHPELEEQS